MFQKMKKILILIMTAILVMSLCPTALMADEAEEDLTLAEGYTEELEGYTSVVTWCANGEKNIYGKFYYPEGFDEAEKYPTFILCHGLNSSVKALEKSKWHEMLSQAGYVVYAFDFCGGSQRNSFSDGNYEDMSILSEETDLNAVLDYILTVPYVDTDCLFLLGQSQGGLVSAMVAAERSEEINALILMYPAFCIPDMVREAVPDLEALEEEVSMAGLGNMSPTYIRDAYDLDINEQISGYDGDVLIIHGLYDLTIHYSYSIDAINGPYMESASELVLLSGKKAVHGFEMAYPEGREYAFAAALKFIGDHLVLPEEEVSEETASE